MTMEEQMSENAFEESRFLADTGGITVRIDGKELFLGVSAEADPESDPDVCIQLTRRQGEALMSELKFWLEVTKEAQDDV